MPGLRDPDDAFHGDVDVVRLRGHLGTLVREARERRAWTQRQLAERCRTSQALIWALETGARPASLATYCRVLAALGVQLTAELEPLDADIKALQQRTSVVPEGCLRSALSVHCEHGRLVVFGGRPVNFPSDGAFDVPVLGVGSMATLSPRRRRSLRALMRPADLGQDG